MSWREELLARPWVYRLWQAPFARRKLAPLVRAGAPARARRVLDLGCGPGTNARLFAGRDYLGVDLEPAYIEHARRRAPGRFLCADACSLDEVLADEAPFDFILSNSLLHHLDDGRARALLAGLPARLAPGGRLHLLDLVRPDGRGPAAFLARHDRGQHARSRAHWEQLLGEHMECQRLEAYSLSLMGVVLWNMIYFEGARRG